MCQIIIVVELSIYSNLIIYYRGRFGVGKGVESVRGQRAGLEKGRNVWHSEHLGVRLHSNQLKLASCTLRKISRGRVGIILQSETQVSDHLGMSGGKSRRHAQNPLSVEWRKALSMPHPQIIICTSVMSSMDCTVFNLIWSAKLNYTMMLL